MYYRILGDQNHNDTTAALVTGCAIAKMPLAYSVRYKTKVYDGKTDGEWETVKFTKWNDQYKVVELTPGVDFTVGKVYFKVPDAGVWNQGTSEVTLTDSERARNYELEGETVLSGGIIKPAPIENCHDLTVYIRYNDTSVHTYKASGFGAPDDENYVIWTRGTEGTSAGVTAQFSMPDQIILQLKDNLTKDDIGKKCTMKVRVQTADGNYSTDPENKDTLQFTAVLVDQYTPEISANPISAVYDGKAISADKISGTAIHDGKACRRCGK